MMVDPRIPIGDEALLFDLCNDTVGCMCRLHDHYGSIVGYPKGTDLTVFAFGPDANHDVYGDCETFHVYGPPGPKNSSQRRFGLGIFGLNGPKQLQHRRLLMPALGKPSVERYAESMKELIDELTGELRVGSTIDLAAAMKKLSLRIACRILFGLRDYEDAEEVAAAFQAWLDDYVRINFAQTLPLEIPVEKYRDWLHAGERLEQILQRLITKRRSYLADDQHDLMAILLRSQNAGEITEAEVLGEIQTLLNASYQTTASGLMWTLLLVAQHPTIARNLSTDTLPEPERMRLLDRVIKESLRILPPVVFVIRRANHATKLAGHDIPEGTIVVLSLYVTHHMKEWFDEPEVFRPDRWLTRNPGPYAYLPFGTGARMCIGTMFSTQLFSLAVPAILGKYRLDFAAGTRVDRHSSLTMGVEGPLPVTLLPREGPYYAMPLSGNIHEMVRLPRVAEYLDPPARAA